VVNFAERWNAAIKAFQQRKPPEGEIALADPRRQAVAGWPTFPYNPSALVSRRGMRVFDAMRLDDQIKAALSFKKGAVLATEWQVHPPEGEEKDWEPVRFVRWVLNNIDGTLEGDIWEILSALDYGYSVTEKVWERAETPFGRRVVLRALKTRRPHDFDFDTDEFGNLKPDGVVQNASGGQKRLPVEKFVVFTNDAEFSNWYGRSDLEAAFRAWWSKDNAYKWLAILLERLGVPPVFGLYDPGRYTPQQIDDLKEIIQNLQAATFGVIPRAGADALDFWAPQLADQATRVFIPALEQYDRAIARAILMPGLLGLTSDVAMGSFARARVSFDVFLLIIERLRREIEERVMMEQVVRPLVDFNFTVDAYPVWRFLPLTDEVRLDILDRWLAAVNANVVRPSPTDEEHIRQMLRFPEAQAVPEPLTMSYARYDRQTNYAEIRRGLDQVEAEAAELLRDQFGVIRDKLLAKIERNFPARASLVEDLDLRGFGDLQAALREYLRRVYEIGQSTLRRELPRKFQLGRVLTPAAALAWLGQKALAIARVWEDKLVADAKQVLLNALKFGEPPEDTLRKLRELFEPYVGDPTVLRDGQPLAPYHLETVLRTNATEAFNQGRLVLASQDDVRSFLRGMVYSAVLDERTTPVCRFLDGKVFPMDEPELRSLAPPNHFSCRSVLVPVTLDMEVDEADIVTPADLGRAEELAQEGFK